MAKLKDYTEGRYYPDNYENHDKKLLEKDINFDLYKDLRQMAQDTCNLLEDDKAFCDTEWNLFREWYDARGFTEDEWLYVEACGYERDQFEREDEYELCV